MKLCRVFPQGNLDVQLEQPPQELSTGMRGDGEPGLTPLILVEVVAKIEIRPGVAREDGVVHRGVEFTQPGDVGVCAGRVMEQIVDGG